MYAHEFIYVFYKRGIHYPESIWKSKQKKEFTDLLLSISGDLLEKKTRYTEHTSNTRLDISAVEEENETLKVYTHLIRERKKGRWTHSAHIREIQREVTYLGGRFENLINSFENSSCTRFERKEL